MLFFSHRSHDQYYVATNFQLLTPSTKNRKITDQKHFTKIEDIGAHLRSVNDIWVDKFDRKREWKYDTTNELAVNMFDKSLNAVWQEDSCEFYEDYERDQ